MSHAILAPSAASIWGKGGCTAYPTLSALFPDKQGEAAKIGEAAHELAEYWINTGSPLASGTPMTNGVIVTEEMITKVRVYIDRINLLKVRHPDGIEFIERKVQTRIHIECWGTLDWALYIPSMQHVYIFDYKHGFLAREVDDQLHTYGNGLVDELVTKLGKPVKSVTLGVIQPRAWHRLGPIREETMHVSGLSESFHRLQARANEVFTNPVTRVGKHCRYCPVMVRCPANQKAVDHILDFVERPQLTDLNETDLGIYLSIMERSKKLLDDRLEVLKEDALERIENQKHVPGYHKGFGRGSRDWTDEKEVKTLELLTGIKLSEEKLITPYQAELAGMPKDLVKQYVTSTQGKSSLKTGDASELAQKVFKL